MRAGRDVKTVVVALAVALFLACASREPKISPSRPRTAADNTQVAFPSHLPFRLPQTLKPITYRARLRIEAQRFSGHIEIDAELAEDTALLWLHAADLTIIRATATSGTTVIPLTASAPRPDERLGLSADSPLRAGQWTITLDYTGQIANAASAGEHRDAYVHGLGVFRRVVGTHSNVFTQSEPTYARRIFPCIDEPDRKVQWQLTLDVPKEAAAVSNTPIIRETALDADYRRVEFDKTLPLPPYLIAFAVGSFDVLESLNSKAGVPIRILAPKNSGLNVKTAAAHAPQILDLLAEWFETPYPYAKLDLLIVPRAAWDAMEHPGLVTFSQGTLEGERGLTILSHEIAHQWFGNIVTMKWWDDIWLNESFAEYWAAKAVSHLRTTRKAEDNPKSRHEALYALATGMGTRAVISSLADLKYGTFPPYSRISQGTHVLKLLELYMGDQRFRIATREYIRRHAHGNADTDAFARVLSDVMKEPLDLAVLGLVNGTVPTLDVSWSCDKGPRATIGTVPWPIPMCIAYDRDGKRAELCTVLLDGASTFELPAKKCPRWVMPNATGRGLYKTQWTAKLIDSILTTGWSLLTTNEKQSIVGEIADPQLKLAVYTRVVRPKKAEFVVVGEVQYLIELSKYVPDYLRSEFDARIVVRYGARARNAGFAQRDGDTKEALRERLDILDLVSLTGVEDLRKQAVAVAARYKELPDGYVFMRPVLTMAANADPAFADELARDLANDGTLGPSTRVAIVAALSNVRDTAGLLARNFGSFSKVGPIGISRFFETACDSASRSRLADLLVGATEMRRALQLQKVDACIAERKQLEPLLRSWLARNSRDVRRNRSSIGDKN